MISFFAISIPLILLDQFSKLYLEKELVKTSTKIIIPKILEFSLHYNEGAAWGLFSGKRLFLILTPLVSAIVLAVFYYKNLREGYSIYARLGIILVFAGAVGNLIDRAFRGKVIDFIKLSFVNFPIFNVADICVTTGVFLLFISLFLVKGDLWE